MPSLPTAGERLGPPAAARERFKPRPVFRGEVGGTEINVYRGTRTFLSGG
jgi:hypothetical protein